jgi:hypothetical protein
VRHGIVDRLEFVNAPGHVEDLHLYRARGYAMKGDRCAIVVDRPQSVVEVHPPSRYCVEMGGVTIEHCPMNSPWSRVDCLQSGRR